MRLFIPGDLVWATDEETGETALKEVDQLFRNETEKWVHVMVNGEGITCTPNHPFYSPVKGWTSAIDLRAGDILVMLNGECVVVEQVQHELLESPETTYNFEVADFHTYYVGDTEVLVHNECQSGNAKHYSEHQSRNAAFRAAKRAAGIPVSEQPIKITPSIDNVTHANVGRSYEFSGGKTIVEHAAGHPQYGIGAHFNGFFNGVKWHFLYPRMKG